MTIGGPTLEHLLGRPGPPPLRVHHILIATAVAAVLLSANTVLRQADVLGLSRFMTSGYGVVYTVLTALAATLIGFGCWWRYEGRAFFDLPGHWLLLEQLLGVGIFVSAGVAATIRIVGSEAAVEAPVFAYFILLNVGIIGIGLWAAWKVADSPGWRVLFLFHACQVPAVLVFGILAGRLAAVAFRAIPVVLLTILVIAALGDQAAHRKRDWPHWMGVVMRAGLYLAAFGQQLWTIQVG